MTSTVAFDKVHSVHIIGIGGTAMGTFAALLRAAGYSVRGSDQSVYPPMSDKLKEWGIPYVEGYSADNLQPACDLVVVGNVIRADNAEAAAARQMQLKQSSFPETLGQMFLADRHSVVVAGTHGKTTTSTLIAHTLVEAGLDPSYLIGGVPQGGGEPFRLGRGSHFVVEGDEYDTVYWDKVPKCWHYKPRSAVLTSVEFDHADIYADFAAVESAFKHFVGLIPSDGTLVFAGAHETVAAVAKSAHCRCVSYGKGQQLDAHDVSENADGLSFEVRDQGVGQGRVQLCLSGEHGVENALAAYGICRGLGLSHGQIAAGFARFGGVRRRLELRGQKRGVSVIDDFAHHPTAVRVTLQGARQRWPQQRLWAVFEPRSATASRKVFQQDFVTAFDAADQVVIARSGRKGQLAVDQSIDEQALSLAISARGVPARYCESVDEIVSILVGEAAAGDIIICMSNGAFGGIHDKLLQALASKG